MENYLGRYQLGDYVPIEVHLTNASGVVTAPTTATDRAPIASVYKGSAKVDSFPISPHTPDLKLFRKHLRLSSSYAAGQYVVAVLWVNGGGGFYGHDEFFFEVVPGGASDGAIIALAEYQRPDSINVLWQEDGGKIKNGKNPAP